MPARRLAAILASSSLLLAASAHAAHAVEPLHHVDLSTPLARTVSELSTRATRALLRGDDRGALDLTQVAIAADPGAPWPHYERAIALAHLGSIEGADAEYRLAEARFGRDDLWGRSIAIYGRGHVLAEAGHCQAAALAFDAFAALVGADDPRAAAVARTSEADCGLPGQAAKVSRQDPRVEDATHALAVAQAEERDARRIERWATWAQESLVADPSATVELAKVRERARRLEQHARQGERDALALLRVERPSAAQPH